MWPFKKKLPHETFPDLLEWKEGDDVKIYTSSYTYLGCNGEYLIFKSTSHPYPQRKLTAWEIRWNTAVENKSLEIRRICEEYSQIKTELSENAYNEFLKTQLEFRQRLLSEMGLIKG